MSKTWKDTNNDQAKRHSSKEGKRGPKKDVPPAILLSAAEGTEDSLLPLEAEENIDG